MKVRELIAASTFTAGAGRSSTTPPRVTIILPTFRRGDSGLLQRTIDSLLGQSFGDFELIVVDDASTDSTARVIRDAMKRDPRVSVIRHQHNIGLPAVSEYEAYVLARGDLISFAFDDTVFYRHGLRRLVRESERHPDSLIAGYVTAFMRSPRGGEILSRPLGAGARESDLMARNVIPNNAVLAPRAIIEQVGLYDPHISLARLCDYDLWLRVRRRFPIRMINTCIGEEHGPATTDSLGHTYPLDHWLSDDRMRQRRDDMLVPARFEDVDVFDVSGFESARSRELVSRLTTRHVAGHTWMSAPSAPSAGAGRVPRIVVLADIDASTQLYFEGLRDVPGLHVRIVDPHARTLSELAEADALVIWRDIQQNADWARAARAALVPTFYFLDDNLPLMAARNELTARAAEFDRETLRGEVHDLDGVLTSTEALAQSFRDQRLHSFVGAIQLVVPAVVAAWRTTDPRPVEHAPTLALFVGPHRLREFRRTLWPALVEAARQTGMRPRLLMPQSAVASLKRLPDRDRVELVPFANSADYFVALRTLNRLGTDAVVVPPARTVNARYKSLHPLMTAAVLGARLVVPASEPYLDLEAMRGVTVVPDRAGKGEWTKVFEALLHAIATRSTESPVVDSELLVTRFDPVAGAAKLLELIGPVLSPEEPDEALRLRRISEWLAVHLALSRVPTDAAFLPHSAGTVTLAADLQAILRSSRQLHALRGTSRILSGFQFGNASTAVAGPRHNRTELSRPLTGIPYLSYPVRIERGEYRRLAVIVLADGLPGDLVGVEIVDPGGKITLHSVAPLPADDSPILVSFDARTLKVEQDATYELRIFARTGRLAFVLESVDRGRFGLRHPRVSPLVRFES